MKFTQHGQISEVQKASMKKSQEFNSFLRVQAARGSEEVTIHCELLPITKAVKITAQTKTGVFFADVGPRGKISDIVVQRI